MANTLGELTITLAQVMGANIFFLQLTVPRNCVIIANTITSRQKENNVNNNHQIQVSSFYSVY